MLAQEKGMGYRSVMKKHPEKNEKEDEDLPPSPYIEQDLIHDDHGGILIGLREKREKKR